MNTTHERTRDTAEATAPEPLTLGPLLETGKAHALIAEDDNELRHALMVHLLRSGYRVSVAASGREAMAFAVRARPDVAILSAHLADGGTESLLDLLGRRFGTRHVRALVYERGPTAAHARRLAQHPAVYALVVGQDVMLSDRLPLLIDAASLDGRNAMA
jgi:CheY-like chemotaxis protein